MHVQCVGQDVKKTSTEVAAMNALLHQDLSEVQAGKSNLLLEITSTRQNCVRSLHVLSLHLYIYPFFYPCIYRFFC